MSDTLADRLERQVVSRYAEVFPNYAYVDAESAIDLMAAEIVTLRAEAAAALRDRTDTPEGVRSGAFDLRTIREILKAREGEAAVDAAYRVAEEIDRLRDRAPVDAAEPVAWIRDICIRRDPPPDYERELWTPLVRASAPAAAPAETLHAEFPTAADRARGRVYVEGYNAGVADALSRPAAADGETWEVTCPVCKGTGELPEAVQAWDVPGAPIPECRHCEDGVLDISKLLARPAAADAGIYAEMPTASDRERGRVWMDGFNAGFKEAAAVAPEVRTLRESAPNAAAWLDEVRANAEDPDDIAGFRLCSRILRTLAARTPAPEETPT